MQVKHHLGCRMQQMDACVNCEARGWWPPGSFQRLAELVDHQETARGNSMEPDPLWIDQESALWKHNREMIADTLMHAEARYPAEGRGHVGSRLLLFGLVARHSRSLLSVSRRHNTAIVCTVSRRGAPVPARTSTKVNQEHVMTYRPTRRGLAAGAAALP